jgi:predicted dehydrogenase
MPSWVATLTIGMLLQMAQACEASKDVYVEKPLSLTIAEGRRMVDVARRTQRVVQVSIAALLKFVKEAADFIRGGGIGQVTVAKCYHILNETRSVLAIRQILPRPKVWIGIWLDRRQRPLQRESLPLQVSLVL